MAEPLKLDLKEINLCRFTEVKTGFIEMDDEQIEVFEQYHWKLFISMIGLKTIDKYKDLIFGECLINFFPGDLEDFNKVMHTQNVTCSGHQLIKPLFYIKFDKDQHIEVVDRSEEKIPKKIFFMILCR